MRFASYDTAEFYDEMLLPDGCGRPGSCLLKEKIEALPDGELLQRQEAAKNTKEELGISRAKTPSTESCFPLRLCASYS